VSAAALVLAVTLSPAAALAAAPADACAGAEEEIRAVARALAGGRWEEAERRLQPLAESHAACADVLIARARLLARRGGLVAAREALEKAVQLDPGNAEARYQLGIWLFRAHRYPEAAAQFEQAAALRAGDARALDYLALCREALGQPERAEQAYREGLQVGEGPGFDPLLDYNYGRFLLKQDRLGESRTYLDRAVRRLPERRGPHYERAKLHVALKDYAAARADAERALSLRDPSGLVLDLQVYYLLATVYARLGETDLARKYAELSRTTAIPGQAGDRR
jgi:tetratricopeptide (TPR) repeat protein